MTSYLGGAVSQNNGAKLQVYGEEKEMNNKPRCGTAFWSSGLGMRTKKKSWLNKTIAILTHAVHRIIL